MLKHIERRIRGCDDFELGRRRASPLDYAVTFPSRGNPAGLVFVIGGFGDDGNPAYAAKLREHITGVYGLTSVSVFYHAFGSRPRTGGRLVLAPEDAASLAAKMERFGCGGPGGTLADRIARLDEAVGRARASNRIDPATLYRGRYLPLSCMIEPARGEYQNFGVMQALDHLHVLYDLTRRGEHVGEPIIALGSSHGGYIANLISKFAPNTLSAVFDNSSYPSPPPHYVVGRELRRAEASHRPPSLRNLIWLCNVQSGWSNSVGSPNYYSEDRRHIRSFPASTIAGMAEYGGNRTAYRFVHSRFDEFVPLSSKLAMARNLRMHGFDVREYVMDEGCVDGRFVKTLEHGMRLSLRMMFDMLLPTVKPTHALNDIDLRSRIAYAGPDSTYMFRYSATGIMPECIPGRVAVRAAA